MLGNFENAQKMSKTGMDTAMTSLGALSKTTQTIASEMAEYAKRSFEHSTKTAEKLFGVKSLDKAIEVQTEYTKAIFEDYTAQVTKVGQIYADFAKEAFRPFEVQVTKVSPTK